MARIALAMVAVCAACMGDRVIAIEAEPAPAHLTVSEARHSFGGVTVGSESMASFRVANDGGEPSTAIVPRLAGDASHFAVAGDCAGRTLAPREGCDLRVTFAPLAAGAHTASLLVPGVPQLDLDGY